MESVIYQNYLISKDSSILNNLHIEFLNTHQFVWKPNFKSGLKMSDMQFKSESDVVERIHLMRTNPHPLEIQEIRQIFYISKSDKLDFFAMKKSLLNIFTFKTNFNSFSDRFNQFNCVICKNFIRLFFC